MRSGARIYVNEISLDKDGHALVITARGSEPASQHWKCAAQREREDQDNILETFDAKWYHVNGQEGPGNGLYMVGCSAGDRVQRIQLGPFVAAPVNRHIGHREF